MEALFLNEHRCQCGKLLLKGVFFDGILEIKCRKCGTMNKIGYIKQKDDATHYLLIINSRGIIVNVSDSASHILGYIGKELIGKHFTKINPTFPKEISKKFAGPKSILNKDNYFKLDTVHQSKSGEKIPIVALLKLYQPTSQERYTLILAELKNTAKDKKTFSKNMPEFLDNACDFYFCIDKNGMMEYVSSSTKNLFGFSPEEIIGKNYFDYLPTETKGKSKKIFRHFSANAEPYRVAREVGRDANGKIVNKELYFTPNFDDSGSFCGYRVLGWVIKKL
jgi:PAS domain S-box-containing protein